MPNGLIAHPDGEHIIFPLGSTIVLKNTVTNTQAFLQGHTDIVTCIALSADGTRLASGQAAAMGMKAPVIVWDVDAAIANGNTADRTGERVFDLTLHKGGITGVAFSPCGSTLATLGGTDDNTLVLWDMDTGKAICGAPAANHAATCLTWYNTRSDALITAGHLHIRKWEVDFERRRLQPTDMAVGVIKRVINCIALDDGDNLAWCGTKSGDVLEINVPACRFVRASKNRFSLGVTSVAAVQERGGRYTVIAGNGDGSLVRLGMEQLQVTAAVQLLGGVTSVALSPDHTSFVAGTNDGNRYVVDVATWEPSLRGTAHPHAINDVVFAPGASSLFVTCSKAEVRLWNAETRSELLRIQVPNLECLCAAIARDGTSIVTGWDDGKIRAFTPESGRLQYVISDAHIDGVTALALPSDGARVLSGGRDGRVRVWNVAGRTQVMELSFKEHKKPVTSVALTRTEDECVSASEDGSCIVWNLAAGVRANALFASTQFRAALYHPDESQLLTCGSDRKLSFWDAVDCSAIRVIDGASAEINALDILQDGEQFVSGGGDRLVKLWLYDEGINTHVGEGHSGDILRLRVSPDGRRVVSVGREGGIFMWTLPGLEAVAHLKVDM